MPSQQKIKPNILDITLNIIEIYYIFNDNILYIK